MAKIYATDLSGKVHEIDGEVGLSVMENLRDNGVDDIAAICGGCCSCATCHVYVDKDWLAKLPEQEPDEYDLVSETDAYQSSSRLSCQIEFSEDLDGLTVTVAPPE